jgi:fused signal recognition particle receptor
VQTTEKLIKEIRIGIKKKEIESTEQLKPFLQEKISKILTEGNANILMAAEHKPLVIMVVGVNGAGKTTTIGKLANYYQQNGNKVIMAC